MSLTTLASASSDQELGHDRCKYKQPFLAEEMGCRTSPNSLKNLL
jgi:hypothetical protein